MSNNQWNCQAAMEEVMTNYNNNPAAFDVELSACFNLLLLVVQNRLQITDETRIQIMCNLDRHWKCNQISLVNVIV